MFNVRNHKNGEVTYITLNTQRIVTVHTDLEVVL